MSKKNLLFCVSITLIALLLKLAQYFIFSSIIEDAFNQESFGYLNELIEKHRLKSPSERTLEFYSQSLSSYTNRLLGIFLFTSVSIYALFRNRRHTIYAFIEQKNHPVNVDVIRIVIFSFLIFANVVPKTIADYKLGKEALVPPFGWDFITSINLPALGTIEILSYIFLASCVLSLLGLFTRWSISIATLLGFFILGISQLYGKIDHTTPIMWQSMVLLMLIPHNNSVISLDNLIFKKRSVPNETAYPYHGIFIISVAILLGLNYFFPGVWKFVFSGFEWAFSENLKFKMYSKWIELDGWRPIIRIDRYPFVYQSAALLTIFFEISFVFGIFFKKIRPYLIITGLGFHVMVAVTMNIYFWSLAALYALFIDWPKVMAIPKVKSSFRSELSRIIKKPLTVAAIIIIVMNVLAGGLLINTWPFSVNPTFASLEKGEISTLVIDFTDTKTNTRERILPLTDENLKELFDTPAGFRGFIESIILRREKTNMDQMIEFVLRTYPTLRDYETATFKVVRISTNPDEDYQILSILEDLSTVSLHE